MITSELYKGKHYGVLGKGRAGNAAIASLKSSEAFVYAWDDKNQDELDIPYQEWPWDKLNALVLSPGIPLTHPEPHPCVVLAQEHGVEILGDVELLYRAHSRATYIGITGTNGKSTTTALIGHILREAGLAIAVGGNLGVPAMALGEASIYVLEMSSYQLDLVHTTCFNIAVWLNLSPDHLDRHGDMAGYMAAKQRIFDRQTQSDLAVVGSDDEYSHRAASGYGGRLTYISMRDKIYRELENATALQGEHNHQNAAAAFAVCRELGIDADTIIASMHSFPGLAHRMQLVNEHNGVLYINDSKATNAEAAEQSLRANIDIYWLVGGVAKEGGIESLTHYLPQIPKVYFYGQDREQLAASLGDHPHALFETLDDAFAAAHADAQAAGKGTVLLAPACASFDQFKDFEARGEYFAKLVREATD